MREASKSNARPRSWGGQVSRDELGLPQSSFRASLYYVQVLAAGGTVEPKLQGKGGPGTHLLTLRLANRGREGWPNASPSSHLPVSTLPLPREAKGLRDLPGLV